MKGNVRRDAIFNLARNRGYVSVDALAEQFGVSQQTARRDIQLLCEQDLLVREHGGASLPPSVVKIDYLAKKIDQMAEKKAIARVVADAIPDGAAVFLAMGTTVEFVAAELRKRQDLRIITNNIHAAGTLLPNERIEVLVAGGTVRTHNGCIYGPQALDFVTGFRADIAVVGVAAVAPDGSLLDFYLDEVSISQAMVRNAESAFLACDHAKFSRRANVAQGKISDMTCVFTDSAPPAGIARLMKASGTELRLCSPISDPV